MSNYDYDDALRTLEYLKKCLPFKPTTAIVSGSGLGDIAGLIDLKITISTNDIPNWPCSTAPGHEGKII
ncbi:MAG: purine-nucleoside phosphorylase, partial [Synergistaceae bacterium]|nr:purine-nucleoside phosphorylase [Synergistaceae bacterium]